MRELKISGNDTGQRLNKYLMKYLDKAPSSFVYKMLRKKNITLNGKKAVGDEILEDNDIVTLFLSEETIDKFKKHTGGVSSDFNKNQKHINLNILYKTSDIVAVHKDVGVLSQKAKADDY
ncbi:MAG: RluA family pseudouridine synthase, partial [Lachnospiraceae bacterium]|nr:RluA family pseudouridine synthase [Lachnospiraceae bacterium]